MIMIKRAREFNTLGLILFFAILVKAGVAGVEILGIEIILCDPYGIAKALEVNYLPLAKELYDVVYVGIVGKTKNVVVGGASLLLCCYHVFATFLLSTKMIS